jgi:mono/diheme cytochrome c family protein
MNRLVLIGAATLGLMVAVGSVGFKSRVLTPALEATPAETVARGRYMAQIGGCHDCHTRGYAVNAGNVPEDQWLTGETIGFKGPWGTTYPVNLRRYMRAMTEDQWVQVARTIESRPPMPWFNLRAMSESDLRALHRYICSLPADDSSVPDYVPPDRKPATPYILFVPQDPGERS